jgi:hypothetical protein
MLLFIESVPSEKRNMEQKRKSWNRKQKKLRSLLESDPLDPELKQLFLMQHAALHSQQVVKDETTWSYEDYLLDNLPDSVFRRIPEKQEHSIAWLIWHIARIEDVTMNMLVGGREQLFSSENWSGPLGIRIQHTGNAMDPEKILDLSRTISFKALRTYRIHVGRRTREIVSELTLAELKTKVRLDRIQRILEVQAVVPEAQGVLSYWSKRTIAGLLLMPATRHNFIHLNEVARIKQSLSQR